MYHSHYFKHVSLLSLVMFIILSGCVSGAQKQTKEMGNNEGPQLTGAETSKAFSGKTASGSGKDFQYARYTAPDGTMMTRTWGEGWEKTDTGTWHIDIDGLICTKYIGVFAKSGERCSKVTHGDAEGKYVSTIVKGKKSKRIPSGIYYQTISHGNTIGIKM